LSAIARSIPTVVTAHGPVEGELGDYYRSLHPNVSLVAISEAQRRNAPDMSWVATVHNAIPVDEYPFRTEKEEFVLFLGRMSPEKGPHLAIDAAREAGWPLVLAGSATKRRSMTISRERSGRVSDQMSTGSVRRTPPPRRTCWRKRAELIDPSECRDRARVHFDVAAMVSRYESV
jgi:glycosyltransferase involved in cell wall biosynthesis